MSVFSRFQARRDGNGAVPGHPAAGDRAATPGPEAPYEGYDRLSESEVVADMRTRSQVELTALDAYERDQKNRTGVIDKLRWMRQSEPLDGYDALSSAEIVSALGAADLPTIKRVRGYERKFANRREVLEAVTAAQHRLRPPATGRG